MAAEQALRFGPYRLDASEEQVRRGQAGEAHSKELLRSALPRGTPEHLVTKEELFRALWPHTAVSDAALIEMHSRDSGGAHRRCAIAPVHRVPRTGVGFASSPLPPPAEVRRAESRERQDKVCEEWRR